MMGIIIKVLVIFRYFVSLSILFFCFLFDSFFFFSLSFSFLCFWSSMFLSEVCFLTKKQNKEQKKSVFLGCNKSLYYPLPSPFHFLIFFSFRFGKEKRKQTETEIDMDISLQRNLYYLSYYLSISIYFITTQHT